MRQNTIDYIRQLLRSIELTREEADLLIMEIENRQRLTSNSSLSSLNNSP